MLCMFMQIYKISNPSSYSDGILFDLDALSVSSILDNLKKNVSSLFEHIFNHLVGTIADKTGSGNS